MTDIQNQDINELVSAWQEYFKTIDNWQELIEGIEPKATGCGPVYELDNKLDRVNESLAIADMRDIEYATPHYHTNDETEIYFVLNGSGLVVIGNGEKRVEKDDVIVIPPDADKIREALGKAGAGKIGEYSFCSFSIIGKGHFKPSENATPHIGEANKLEVVEEEQIEVICDRVNVKQVAAALRKAHPYEEPVVDIVPLLDEE